jgi:glycosyltransferase involved in cell wall biosynthesis
MTELMPTQSTGTRIPNLPLPGTPHTRLSGDLGPHERIERGEEPMSGGAVLQERLPGSVAGTATAEAEVIRAERYGNGHVRLPHLTRARRPEHRDPVTEPRLNICMLAACPFPANIGTPGAIREIAEAIAGRDHEVHIVTYHLGQDIPVNGPHVHRIAPWQPQEQITVGPTKQRPFYDLQMVFKTLEVIRRYRCDLIQAHGYEAALAGLICRSVTGLPVLYTGHNTMADELPTYKFIRPKWLALGFGKLLDAFVPRTCDRCLPHSLNMERFFRGMRLGTRAEPAVPFAIDVDAVVRAADDGSRARGRYGLGDRPVIAYAGTLDAMQRVDLLLDAMTHVSRQEPRATVLVLVTNPIAEHLNEFRRGAAERGLGDRVVLTDPLTLPEVPGVLSAADVCVAPRPATPGMSIKLLNYMALAKPSVLFASSTTHGLVHRDNVMLAAPDTTEAFGQAILDVLRDDGLRQRLARRGHDFVRDNHDGRVVAGQICAAYYRTLEAAGRLPASVRGAR